MKLKKLKEETPKYEGKSRKNTLIEEKIMTQKKSYRGGGRTAANTAGRGRQRRPAPAKLPSPKETAFAKALAATPPAPPAPAKLPSPYKNRSGAAAPIAPYAKGGKVAKPN